MKQTRIFSFPNAGHSVRKLSLELEKLEDTPVSLKIEFNEVFGEYELSFIENPNSKVIASKLAKKILTLGTRFTINVYTSEITFSTDFDDILSNPETYL